MTTITFEVPDEIAGKIKLTPENLLVLIKEALAKKLNKLSPANGANSTASPIYQELVDLLVSSPTSEQIVAFKISETAQERLEELLYQNRESALTASERTELETYLQLSHLVTRLKARARNGQPFVN